MTETPEARYADDAQRYRLDTRIATGGMGEVWRATDTSLGREVAVKLLKDEYADDPSFRARFEVEAQHAGALHHHNIATVYDYGAGDGRPYLTALLTLDDEALHEWGVHHGRSGSVESLSTDPEVLAEVAESVERVNREHAERHAQAVVRRRPVSRVCGAIRLVLGCLTRG